MSRGGRRRRAKRGVSRTAEKQPQRPVDHAVPNGASQRVAAQGRRAQPRPQAEREVQVLEAMLSRPRQLKTLPPDGLVLEELIAGMQSEYGVPSTPQEYRLLVKIASDDSIEQPGIEPKPSREVPSGAEARARTARRRHRARHSVDAAGSVEGMGEAGGSTGTGRAADSIPPPPSG
jgi:hypothetical protein